MSYVQVYDTTKKSVCRLILEIDHTIRANYFKAAFPGATGLMYKDNDLNQLIM